MLYISAISIIHILENNFRFSCDLQSCYAMDMHEKAFENPAVLESFNSNDHAHDDEQTWLEIAKSPHSNWGLCNKEYPPETHLKLKSLEISFIYIMGKRDFMRFDFKMRFRQIWHIAQGPMIR